MTAFDVAFPIILFMLSAAIFLAYKQSKVLHQTDEEGAEFVDDDLAELFSEMDEPKLVPERFQCNNVSSIISEKKFEEQLDQTVTHNLDIKKQETESSTELVSDETHVDTASDIDTLETSNEVERLRSLADAFATAGNASLAAIYKRRLSSHATSSESVEANFA